jgi:hypothetical protein
VQSRATSAVESGWSCTRLGVESRKRQIPGILARQRLRSFEICGGSRQTVSVNGKRSKNPWDQDGAGRSGSVLVSDAPSRCACGDEFSGERHDIGEKSVKMIVTLDSLVVDFTRAKNSSKESSRQNEITNKVAGQQSSPLQRSQHQLREANQQSLGHRRLSMRRKPHNGLLMRKLTSA